LNFNRRVTPELDAISLKALARDVADRYQNAAQLAADLDGLIAGYRFDPKELRQFMRQLFRKEYAHELEETQQALEAEPSAFHVTVSQRTTDAMETPTRTMPGVHGAVEEPSAPVIEQIQQPPSDPGPAPGDGNKPKGFWGSLFKRKK
jgi:hypothetical protein